jgi:hypothetical protein
MIIYRTLYLKNVVEVANPKFNRDIVRALFSHGFCPFSYCAMIERMPSLFFFKEIRSVLWKYLGDDSIAKSLFEGYDLLCVVSICKEYPCG